MNAPDNLSRGHSPARDHHHARMHPYRNDRSGHGYGSESAVYDRGNAAGGNAAGSPSNYSAPIARGPAAYDTLNDFPISISTPLINSHAPTIRPSLSTMAFITDPISVVEVPAVPVAVLSPGPIPPKGLPDNSSLELEKIRAWRCGRRWRWFWILKKSMTLIHIHVMEHMLEETTDTILFACLQIAYNRYMVKWPLSPPEPGMLSYIYQFWSSDCHLIALIFRI